MVRRRDRSEKLIWGVPDEFRLPQIDYGQVMIAEGGGTLARAESVLTCNLLDYWLVLSLCSNDTVLMSTQPEGLRRSAERSLLEELGYDAMMGRPCTAGRAMRLE